MRGEPPKPTPRDEMGGSVRPVALDDLGILDEGACMTRGEGKEDVRYAGVRGEYEPT
jgi:hypothetical protein